MNYKVLKNNRFDYLGYAVVPYRKNDRLRIMEWRNEQMDVLRQKNVLTEPDQDNYYNNYIEPSFLQESPRIILFSFLQNDECIGYGGLTNIDWESKRIELSFLVATERTRDEDLYRKDFTAFITLMKKVVFEDLEFNRIFTETFDIRPLHINILETNGFQLEGRMKQHVFVNENFTDSLIHGFLKRDYYA